MTKNCIVLTVPVTVALASPTPFVNITGLTQWRLAYVIFDIDNSGGAVANGGLLSLEVRGETVFECRFPVVPIAAIADGEFGVGLTDIVSLGGAVNRVRAALPPVVFDSDGDETPGRVRLIGEELMVLGIRTVILDRCVLSGRTQRGRGI